MAASFSPSGGCRPVHVCLFLREAFILAQLHHIEVATGSGTVKGYRTYRVGSEEGEGGRVRCGSRRRETG